MKWVEPELELQPSDWRDTAMPALRRLAETGREFEAFDLTEAGVPDPENPNQWGALFQAAYRAGVIERVGFRESRRPSRARGLCRVWRGVDAVHGGGGATA